VPTELGAHGLHEQHQRFVHLERPVLIGVHNEGGIRANASLERKRPHLVELSGLAELLAVLGHLLLQLRRADQSAERVSLRSNAEVSEIS
jgi:hypothetical protein